MAVEPEVKEPRDTGSILFALIVAGIVVAAGAVAYVLYANSQRISGVQPYAVVAGDTVTLDYIGRFADGRIFDTSIWDVAKDDALYPKSLTFTLRSNDSYKAFSMEAGKYGVGGTIKGFALGVIGLHVGDYELIEIAPEDAYPVNASMIASAKLTEIVPVKELYSVSGFKSYFNTEPLLLSTTAHYFWKWKVLVADISGDVVTVLNQPTVGSSVYPFGDPTSSTDPNGWEVRVISYDPGADEGVGRITVQNMVSAEDVYRVKGTDTAGNAFVISRYDADNGTFEIHRSDSSAGYNGEISGRALFFEVTIVKIEPAAG